MLGLFGVLAGLACVEPPDRHFYVPPSDGAADGFEPPGDFRVHDGEPPPQDSEADGPVGPPLDRGPPPDDAEVKADLAVDAETPMPDEGPPPDGEPPPMDMAPPPVDMAPPPVDMAPPPVDMAPPPLCPPPLVRVGPLELCLQRTAVDPGIAAARTGLSLVALPQGRAMALGGDRARAGGLTTASNDVDLLGDDGFSVTTPLLRPLLVAPAGVVQQGRVVIAGGLERRANGTIGPTRALFSATPGGEDALVWMLGGDMSRARAGHRLIVLNAIELLLVGGVDAEQEALGSLRMTVDGSQWREGLTAALVTARSEPGATKLADGRVFVFGGFGLDGRAVAAPETYDPVQNRWTAIQQVPLGLRPQRVGRLAALAGGARVLIAGGIDAAGADPYDDAVMFEPGVAAIVPIAPLNVPRDGHTITAIGPPETGRALVLGGEVDRVAVAEVFDPAAGFVAVPLPDAWSLVGHAAVQLDDGTVLVVGGQRPDGRNVTEASIYRLVAPPR
ncbi:MAG: hypothetical protein KC620_05835 [Myxococcales bacterium]|nr:hypothetical protein [Myxococcales bacterium]